MAMRPTCDVCRTAKGVKRYQVTVLERDPEADAFIIQGTEPIQIDLCPRDLERLKAKIKTGTTPPPERNTKPKETTT